MKKQLKYWWDDEKDKLRILWADFMYMSIFEKLGFSFLIGVLVFTIGMSISFL